MDIKQAGNILMSAALNSDFAHDKDFIQAVKTLVDASKNVERKNLALKIFADLYGGDAFRGDTTEIIITVNDIYEAQQALKI